MSFISAWIVCPFSLDLLLSLIVSYFQNAFHGERTKLYDIGMKFPFPNETDTHFVTFALVEPRVVSLDEHFKVE